MEAERDHAASRAKQLQKAVAESEEGESSLHILLPPTLLATEVGGWGIGVLSYNLTQDTFPGQPQWAQTYRPSMVQAELGEGGVQIGPSWLA